MSMLLVAVFAVYRSILTRLQEKRG
jgi:hypothetical protein